MTGRATFAPTAVAMMAWAATVGGLPLPCGAQSPPNSSFERREVFSTYEDFKGRLTAISSEPNDDKRLAALDALWTELKDAGQIPFVHGDKTAFLYRGDAESVAWAGDFNGWKPSDASWSGAQLAGTDLWLLEKTFAEDARVDYKVVVNGSNWLLDPANSLQVFSGFGPNSELRMPAYKFPPETVRRAGVARRELSGDKKIASAKLGYDVNYRVYTPVGYEENKLKDLPVVYVTDGHEYAADHMGSMVVVLDNLIADESLQPTMAVFIDPRDPATGANRRHSENVENAKFAAFVADELAPAVDAAYRTRVEAKGRAILGTSLGGLNSAYFGATRPDAFGLIAVQSPADFSRFAPATLKLYASEPLQDKLKIFVTAGTIGDGNGGTDFVAILKEHKYDYKFVEVNEGHSWGAWRGLLDIMLIELIGPKKSR